MRMLDISPGGALTGRRGPVKGPIISPGDGATVELTVRLTGPLSRSFEALL